VFAWLKKDLYQKPVIECFPRRGGGPLKSERDGTHSVVLLSVGGPGRGRSHDPTFVRGVIDAASNAKVDKFIWKTTTKKAYFIPMETLYHDPDREVKYYKHDYVLCGIPNITCFNTSWTKKVNHTSLMWDSLHFMAPVYNHLNVQLMKLL
jgi:hypothetical protein